MALFNFVCMNGCRNSIWGMSAMGLVSSLLKKYSKNLEIMLICLPSLVVFHSLLLKKYGCLWIHSLEYVDGLLNSC